MIPDDDQHMSKRWTAFLKDSAYYYDQPTVAQERFTLQNLKQRFDELFPSSWRPPMQSRRDLLTWVCEQRNQALAESHEPLNCSYNALLQDFGPNTASLREKLGDVRGLWN